MLRWTSSIFSFLMFGLEERYGDISWRIRFSSIVIASAQGIFPIFPVDTWPRFDDSLEVCYCDFIQLCGKFLWLTFDIITNYRGIHKQANVLRRYGVCVCVNLNECIFPMLSPSIFSTHRYFRDQLVKIHSWTTPGQFYHKHIPYSLTHQYCFCICVYIYMIIYVWFSLYPTKCHIKNALVICYIADEHGPWSQGPLKVVMESPISSIKLAPAPGHSASSTPKKWPWGGSNGSNGSNSTQKKPRRFNLSMIFSRLIMHLFWGSLILTQTYIFWVWPEQMRGEITPNPTGLSSPKCQAILFLQAKSEGNIIQI